MDQTWRGEAATSANDPKRTFHPPDINLKKEARDKLEARKAEALSAAKTAVEKVNQQIKPAGEAAARDTKALQAKITADVNALKAHVVEAKHGLDVKLAEKNAELLEEDAGFAIDYAIGSIEQARLAVSYTHLTLPTNREV